MLEACTKARAKYLKDTEQARIAYSEQMASVRAICEGGRARALATRSSDYPVMVQFYEDANQAWLKYKKATQSEQAAYIKDCPQAALFMTAP